MYLVSGIKNVAYTKNQLQVVKVFEKENKKEEKKEQKPTKPKRTSSKHQKIIFLLIK